MSNCGSKTFNNGNNTDRYRLNMIRTQLRRGDKKLIAELAGVHRVWVSYVLAGEGRSERVLRAAEQLILSRKQETNQFA